MHLLEAVHGLIFAGLSTHNPALTILGHFVQQRLDYAH